MQLIHLWVAARSGAFENVSMRCWYHTLQNMDTHPWECEWCPHLFIKNEAHLGVKNKGHLGVYACIDNHTSKIMADPFCVFLALYSMAWNEVTHSIKITSYYLSCKEWMGGACNKKWFD